jgi:D-serine deaminase-like pyridoxal phosphate-dependent protein
MKPISISQSAGSLESIRATVARERAELLTWSDKPIIASWYGKTVGEVLDSRPQLHEMSTPVMTLDARILGANRGAMAAWCDKLGVDLAPHGKTTVSPALWLAQLEAGCWGITVANEPQLRVARGVGVGRIVLANLLLSKRGLIWLSQELAADPDFEFVCWVDSVEAVRLMTEALREVEVPRPIRVCVEVGLLGERTGARSVSEAVAVAHAVVASPVLALSGVSCYEGGADGHEVGAAKLERIDSLMRYVVEVHEALAGSYECDEVIISAGGSTFFDRVAALLAPLADPTGAEGRPTRVIVRSGGYLIHDEGMYPPVTPSTRNAGPKLVAAMHVWSRVLSTPEPGLALLDAGKRDLPYDIAMPVVQQVCRIDNERVTALPVTGCTIFALNDQHAFVRTPEESPLAVGDVVRLGLSHPCAAFDRWSLISVIDNSDTPNPVVVDMVRTYF